MKPKPIPLSQTELETLFDYNPETGVLKHKHRLSASAQWNSRFAGKEAGWLQPDNGYIFISIHYRRYRAHRVIYKLFYGIEPTEIDHINGDRADNRITNLRVVNRKQNTKNQKKRSNNTSGVTGITFDNRGLPKPWRAKWHDENGKQRSKYFKTKEEACEYREMRILSLGYSKNHGKR